MVISVLAVTGVLEGSRKRLRRVVVVVVCVGRGSQNEEKLGWVRTGFGYLKAICFMHLATFFFGALFMP